MSPRFPDPARFAGSRLLRVQSDERLVALTRDGYETAFSAIVDRYRTPLERYAGRIVGESRAEDAVQQAFANAHRALMRDDRPIALKAWLYRITHNASLNHLRAIRDEVTLDDESLGRPATAMAATHDTTSVAELRARLRETLDLIAALPATQRDALLLAELEGRSHEEIALALDIPSETVRHRVMQARTTLRAAVSAIVPYPIAASLAAAAGSGSETARTAAEIAAGAGAGAVAIKITAGLTATGALVTAFALPSLDAPKQPTDRGSDRQVVAGSAERGDPRTRLAAAPVSAPALLAGQRGGSGAERGSAATGSALVPSIDEAATGTPGLGELVPPPAASIGFTPAVVDPASDAATVPTAQRRRGNPDQARRDDGSRAGDHGRRKRPSKSHRIDGVRKDEEPDVTPAPADHGPGSGPLGENGDGQGQDAPRRSDGVTGPDHGPSGDRPGGDKPSGGKPGGGNDAPASEKPSQVQDDAGPSRPAPGPAPQGTAPGRGPTADEQSPDEHGPATDPQRQDDTRARKPS